MNPQKRLYIILSILSLVITGMLLFNFLSQFESEKNYKEIIVSSRNISDAKILEETDLEFKKVPSIVTNENVFYKKEDLIGQNLSKPLAKNTIIYKTDIFSILDPESVAAIISKDKKAFVIDEDWLDGSLLAKKNDYVDITIGKKNVNLDENTFLIRNAKVLKIAQNQNGGKSLIIELTEPEIIALSYARSNDLKINIVINPIN